jgi:hypothetical protein
MCGVCVCVWCELERMCSEKVVACVPGEAGELGRLRTRSRKQREREASGVEAGLLVTDGGVFQALHCKKKRVFMVLFCPLIVFLQPTSAV